MLLLPKAVLEAYELLAKPDDEDGIAELGADVEDSTAADELLEPIEANVDSDAKLLE